MAKEAGARRAPAQAARLGAELLGTFLLTFVAAGADIVDAITAGTIGHVARYIAPALMVMGLIWSLAPISGAHFNPVVTLAFFIRRSFPARRLAGYWSAQFVGAAVAGLLLRVLFGSAIQHAVTHPTVPFTSVQAVIIEAVLSFALVYVILATSEEAATVGKNAALAVAGVIALAGLAFSPLSGASMNPARSFGPQVIAGILQYSWIYFAGPVIGAICAALVVQLIHGAPNKGEYDAGHGKHAHDER